MVSVGLYSHVERQNLRALDEVVTDEATVKARAVGGLGKSGESGHATGSRGGS